MPRRPPELPTAVDRPPGTPDWITDELLAQTLRVWQPYYATRLTPHDAVEMLVSTEALFNVLKRPCRTAPT